MGTFKKRSISWGAAPLILFLFFTNIRAAGDGWPKKMVITAPVADLRHEASKKSSSYDPRFDWNQTTQLLFGDRVIAFEPPRRGWLKVAAIEQKIFVKNKWHCCTGWIREKKAKRVPYFYERNLVVKEPWTRIRVARRKINVSIGTKLFGTRLVGHNWEIALSGDRRGYVSTRSVNLVKNKNRLRDRIIQVAKRFVGSPYFLGGRSFSCVDCSGLVGICYQTVGINLPKNAKSQYQKCKKIRSNPKPGDLIFTSNTKSRNNISHVMLYLGHDSLIEARWGEVKKVQLVNVKERLGEPIHEIRSGDKVGRVYVFFGGYLS
jgi:cell wall-associated NlpC family hydrolase